MPDPTNRPFLFGAQYYRAPTPEPSCWELDMAKMEAMGFQDIKFWVQWRWSHRQPDQFTYEDLDRLMDLAGQYHLRVTLNVIFDVAPLWLYEHYPDAKQIMNNGQTVEPYTVGHRQIGGHPGPCYNHSETLQRRQQFLKETLYHFREHPALAMWDVWNEPELCFPQRTPNVHTLVCYCENCIRNFKLWLREKYQSVHTLNQVWGRMYDTWQQVEVPRNPHTMTDFIDWREFHIDTMTAEAKWRLHMVEDVDSAHIRYLHVVPNVMSVFNAVTCAADDFALAEDCEVFGATMNGGPILATQVISAAQGKVVYNVESHINHGCTSLHQRILSSKDVLFDFLPQIGLGIRGFLFWQYRPEVLGFESPGWGLVNLDGSERDVTRAATEFWNKIKPHTAKIMECAAPEAEIGIWKSRKNEIFHYAIHQNFKPLVESVEGYIHALYWQSLPFRIINSHMLETGSLSGLKLIIMPSPYYLTTDEALQLDTWVREGGVLLSDAHLCGYNGSTGRHSRVLPGCGLAESWGIREQDSTSSYHLKLDASSAFEGSVTEDVKKALSTQALHGGAYFPIRMKNPPLLWGADRYARLAGDDMNLEGFFETDDPCVVSKQVGNGTIYYAGTNLGLGSSAGAESLMHFLHLIALHAGVQDILINQPFMAGQVHADILQKGNQTHYLVMMNQDTSAHNVTMSAISTPGRFTGLYSGLTIHTADVFEIPAQFVDLFFLTQ